MKYIIKIFLVVFLVLIGKNSFAQFTGVAYIENAEVNALVFSWELHFERTNDWTPGLLTNALGSSSASFNFDTLALTNPSLILDPGGPLDNANYPSVTAQIINGKCIVDIPFALNALAGTLPLNVKTKLLTVNMDITNTGLTAGLGWDALNTGFFDNADATVNATLTGSSNTPLPVELTSFTSKLLKNEVQLNWVTKTEVNNFGFNVERRINYGDWSNIGFVEGHGNSNSPKRYLFKDNDLFVGGSKFQYRLKQVDTDGQFEYSDIVEVEVVPTEFELSQNYPNPFNPSTTIEFSLPEDVSNVRLSIYNALGEKVAELVNGSLVAGKYQYQWNAENIATGMYIYELRTDKFVSVKKMLLLK